MSHFKFITPQYAAMLTAIREGETKLGEHVHIMEDNHWQNLADGSAIFVLIGIPEDIGVRANYGIGGTSTLWEPALKALLNIQETDKISGGDLAVLGYFDFAEWHAEPEHNPIEEWRTRVEEIDEEVAWVIEKIVSCNKIPIVIGGGHNNAYPIIKGVSKAKNEPINCINLDAHSDYRRIEGRHSGNGFRYAKMEGYLKRYVALGLDENYNGRNVLEDMDADDDIRYYMFEDIFLHGLTDFKEVLSRSVQFVRRQSCGVEVDVDRIEGMLSSAATPCGVTPLQARQFVSYMAKGIDAAYLHIAEGVIKLETGREDALTAKMVAYLVTDFIKGVMNRML